MCYLFPSSVVLSFSLAEKTLGVAVCGRHASSQSFRGILLFQIAHFGFGMVFRNYSKRPPIDLSRDLLYGLGSTGVTGSTVWSWLIKFLFCWCVKLVPSLMYCVLYSFYICILPSSALLVGTWLTVPLGTTVYASSVSVAVCRVWLLCSPLVAQPAFWFCIRPRAVLLPWSCPWVAGAG